MLILRAPLLSLLSLLFAAPLLGEQKAAAAGGEDFPFFCMLDNEPILNSFQVVADESSDTGYAIQLVKRDYVDGYFPVRVKDSEDGKWWVIWGVEYGYTLFMDRHILAYINKETGDLSHEDVKLSLRNGSGRQWSMKPMRCGRGS